jgi:hypothetical protein
MVETAMRGYDRDEYDRDVSILNFKDWEFEIC